MATHNDLGKKGEQAAVEYLLQQGYVILERNWRFQKAEIDIIAQKGDICTAVEVKSRTSLEFGLPQEFVTPKKQKLSLMAFDAYIIQQNINVQARFDIIAIYFEGELAHIEHIEEAFYPF